MYNYIKKCLQALLLLITISFSANAAVKAHSSFAIIIDSGSYRECKAEVDAYKSVLDSEGLATYILAAEWKSPEEVKRAIEKIALKKPGLEGMVFVGDIPVVRVRKGQHLTTAFKMNESTFPREESSVTSDRYYDTPSLKFEFIGVDSLNNRHFYYNLLSDGAQVLLPAYYSARILVPEELVKMRGVDKYTILRNYLKKVVDAHKERNNLDHFVHFAGHGYNSDCLTAWRQQHIAFRSYFPQAFEKSEGNKFLNFRQDRVMKFTLFTQLQRPGTDLFMFYEHGAPDTQYINGDYPARNTKEYIDMLKYAIRGGYYRIKADKRADYIEDVCNHFHLDKSEFTPEKIRAFRGEDSTFAANKDIHLEDLANLKTSPRVTIFNACYNGSFHQPGYVAGYHIFNDGRTVVTQGNTVNVLQDKWAEQLIGLLSMGARIGFWQKEVVTLESHLVGDPTFRFYPEAEPEANIYGTEKGEVSDAMQRLGLDLLDGEDINAVLYRTTSNGIDAGYWKNLFENAPKAPMIRALALKQLQKNYLLNGKGAGDFSDFAFSVFKNDKNMVVRMQALYGLSHCADKNFTEAIRLGLSDTYEMVRRQAAHYAGKNGEPSLRESLMAALESTLEVQRVDYAVKSALRSFRTPKSAETDLKGKKAIQDLRGMRNTQQHWQALSFVKALVDNSISLETRLVLAESLGWYNYSYIRMDIANGLNDLVVSNQVQDKELKEEILKSIKRLKNATR